MTEKQAEPEAGWSDVLGANVTNPPTERVSGETVFSLDQEWRVSSDETRIKAQYELWIRRNALLAVEDAARELDADSAALYRSAYLEDRAAGAYNWPEKRGRTNIGRAVRKSLSDLPGQHYFFYLLLRRCHREMTEELSARIYEGNRMGAATAIGWALGNFGTPAAPPAAGAKTDPALATLN